MSNEQLTIKELTERVGGGVTPRMVRHYHQIGLMPLPQRSQGNYRLYTSQDVQRLQRVMALKQQGFQLAHVKQLLNQSPVDPSHNWMQQLQQHYRTVIDKLTKLRQTAQALERLLGRDQACQKLQAEIIAQLQILDVETQDGLDEWEAIWQQLDQGGLDHPEAFKESLDPLLPDLSSRSEIEVDLIRDIILACGDVSLIPFLHISSGSIAVARHQLQSGCSVVVDVSAVAAALDQPRLHHLRCSVHTLLADPHITTVHDAEQSAWQDPEWRISLQDHLEGSVVVIGYSPSLLMHLCKWINQTSCQPALIVGLPIGFNHAPAAKRLLTQTSIPHITIKGSFGGGLLAAVIINSLAASLLKKPNCHCYLQQPYG